MDSQQPANDDSLTASTPPAERRRSWLDSRWAPAIAAALIVVAGLVAYANSFSGPFLYDDIGSIVDNPSIRRLLAIGQVFSPPCRGETVSGRPLLNLSFAIDYAIGGANTRGYHVANLAIHILNGLLLLGILRRTFCMPVLRPGFGKAALELALAISVLWVLHPLQTESVTYIAQRAESLAAMFFLLVLYAAIRAATCNGPQFWHVVAVMACLLGVATKETVIVAPLMVLLYDRTFVTGSFREALRRRWGLYAGLIGSWVLLMGLVWSTGLWSRQQELGSADPWSYARSQPGVILHYLRLSLWPHPLCFNDEWPVAHTLGAILPAALAIGVLGTATVWGLMRRRAWGFLAAWFFLILAPTSSIMPLRQLAFEHRMYLPLAAVVTLVVAGLHAASQRMVGRGWISDHASKLANVGLVLAAAGICAVLTVRRNEVYHSPLSLWRDTVAKSPHNLSAYNNLGQLLATEGRTAEALDCFQQAVRVDPRHVETLNNMGSALVQLGRAAEAIDHHEAALRIEPDNYLTHDQLGNALSAVGRHEEAFEHYQAALRLKPDHAEGFYNWGVALFNSGRPSEAIDRFKQAVQIQPGHAKAQTNWGNALYQLGRQQEAIEHYQRALAIQADAVAHNNLGLALASSGRPEEAIEHYRAAVQLKPDYSAAHSNWGIALSALNRYSEAFEHFDDALRIEPDYAAAHRNYANALADSGHTAEAIEHSLQAVRCMPDQPQLQRFAAWLMATHEPVRNGEAVRAVELAQRACALTDRRDTDCLDTLAAAYASAGRFDEAVSTAKEAWRLAQAAGQASLAEDIHIRLQLYRDRKPYREAVVTHP
jgi:tetratricopeptide (TPR) repeat protein